MARGKLKSIITSFTSDGDFIALLSPNGLLKVISLVTGIFKCTVGFADCRLNYTLVLRITSFPSCYIEPHFEVLFTLMLLFSIFLFNFELRNLYCVRAFGRLFICFFNI